MEHVGICYGKLQRFLKNTGIESLHYFAPIDATNIGSEVKAISVSSLGEFPLMVDGADWEMFNFRAWAIFGLQAFPDIMFTTKAQAQSSLSRLPENQKTYLIGDY